MRGLLTVSALPTLNAALNASSAALLVSGWFQIKAGRREAHRACMLAALACSGVFLASYLYYHAKVGSVRFPGTGAARTLYLSILASHTLLAAVVPVAAFRLVFLAAKERFDAHSRLARWVLPAWLYVSVTGVVVYTMLYRMSW